jgi:hypothetical protein
MSEKMVVIDNQDSHVERAVKTMVGCHGGAVEVE